MDLMENIERYGFYAFDNTQFFEVKSDVIDQIRNFPLSVTAKGYFTLNRQLFAVVSSLVIVQKLK